MRMEGDKHTKLWLTIMLGVFHAFMIRKSYSKILRIAVSSAFMAGGAAYILFFGDFLYF
jgi:hypothetical protein